MRTVRIRAYDGGVASGFADRYTVFLDDEHEGGLALSADADSPQGVCMWIETVEGDFGQRIPLARLPASASQALARRAQDAYGETELELVDDPAGSGTEIASGFVAGPRSRPSALAERIAA